MIAPLPRIGLLLLIAAPIAAQDREIAIVGVSIADATAAEARADHTVLVRGDRIAAVGARADVAVPDGATIIDGAGKFLIPGLWDMHVHATASPRFAALHLANGVTGVRDMASPMMQIEMIRQGEGPAPRIIAGGRIVDGVDPFWPGSVEVADAAAGTEAVTTVREDGSDFVKVYSKLSREAYYAIAEEATRQGIPFAGHVPPSVSVVEAAAAGQRSIEHLTGVLESCSTEEEKLRQRGEGRLPTTERIQLALATFDADKAAALYAACVEHGTWHCPTLTVLRSIAHLDDEEFRDDPRLRYIPPFWLGFWNPASDRRFASFEPEDWEQRRAEYRKHLEIVGAMHAAGVRILAGTDVANPFCFPGFSLHDELGLLVEAGLSTRDALATATLEPARFLERVDDFGAVAAGKLADLVLLDANPLADIGNTRKIRAVISRGVLYDRDALDEMLGNAAPSSDK